MVIFQPDLAVGVFLCDVSESTAGGLEAGTIPVLNREHTEFACGNLTTVTHTAIPCVPSIDFQWPFVKYSRRWLRIVQFMQRGDNQTIPVQSQCQKQLRL